MKTTMTKVSAALALLALSSSVAMAAVANTRHNLGNGNPAGNGVDDADGTSEICVFCHTPHGGDSTAVVPLWNRITTSAGAFTTYADLATGTFEAAEDAIGSISIACLSCHDGTQAMDVVLNAPYFGGKTTNSTINGSNGVSGWADGHRMDGTNSQGANLADELVYIGTDLRNDHPISMQYGGGNLTDVQTTTAAGGLKDPDFVIPDTGTTTAGNRIWWIETAGTTAGVKNKADLPLYTRTFGGNNQPTVECGTCHDPHTSNTTFLRPTNANEGSAVCLACHIK